MENRDRLVYNGMSKIWRTDMGISTVLLSYQEEENLKILIPKIKKYLELCGEEYEIIVVDTMKPLDNTKQVCMDNQVRYVNQEEPSFGGAFRIGIKYATKDKFLILDSDGSHLPRYILPIYKKFKKEKCDVVIGSRYVKGGETNDSMISQMMSRTLIFIFRLCLGINAKDISTDYRMYDTKQLKAVTLTCKNYDVLQEVLLKLKLKNKKLKIGEVPICFEKRMFGESKRQLWQFILSYMKTLVYLMKIRFTEKKKEK